MERKGKKRGRKEMRAAIETIEWKPERAMSFDEEEDEKEEKERLLPLADSLYFAQNSVNGAKKKKVKKKKKK